MEIPHAHTVGHFSQEDRKAKIKLFSSLEGLRPSIPKAKRQLKFCI
jgi:hypothetical protein